MAEGVDKFITADLKSGRMVDVITRGEPGMMVCHWTGIHWNGEERGFKVFQEVVKRLHARFDNLNWMKLCKLARYWAAKECTAITLADGAVRFRAPWSCPDFTVEFAVPQGRGVKFEGQPLTELESVLKLRPGTWARRGGKAVVCFAMPKGQSALTF